jgi:hypothetical protein
MPDRKPKPDRPTRAKNSVRPASYPSTGTTGRAKKEGHAFTRATKSAPIGATSLPKAGVEASAVTTDYCRCFFIPAPHLRSEAPSPMQVHCCRGALFATASSSLRWSLARSPCAPHFLRAAILAMMKSRSIVVAGALIPICIICVTAYFAWKAVDPSFTRALGEEKSYFNHGGTLYRLRPELRGQKGNLETWDEAEQIVAVIRSSARQGTWAAWSNQLELPQALRLDPAKRPMCVIRLNEDVYVVRGVKKQVAKCEPVQPGFSVSNVGSGELAPSSDGKAEIYYARIGSPAQTSRVPYLRNRLGRS